MNAYFLLRSKLAEQIYTEVSALPIIDYHNHLSIEDISNNKRFDDVYDLWIKPDPYKHRAMRMCGVDERYITGDASKEEKFLKWAEVLPRLQLNPLSHWSAMELNRIFGVKEFLNAQNAKRIYEQCNLYLQKNAVTVGSLLDLFQVEYACPCQSLIDDITCFIGNKRFSPSLRGDDIVLPTKSFLEKLEQTSQTKISSLLDFEVAVEKRLKDFREVGCRFADHALDNGFTFYEDDLQNGQRFDALISGEIGKEDKEKLSSYILVRLASLYAKYNFVLQLHIGAQRYTSTRLRNCVGPAGGFAGIGNSVNVMALTSYLDSVESTEYGLPKILLFTLNPADNALVSVLSGSYAKDGMEGLITQGPAWWWCDHKLGMVDMLENTATFSVLSNFIGMTTDSRSFLSFVRHDYFRRVLCDWLAKKYENGEILCELNDLKDLAINLCYNNAKNILENER
jgi:glucuronate isomerase